MFGILTLLKYFFEDFFVRQPLGQIDNLGLVLPSLPTYLILVLFVVCGAMNIHKQLIVIFDD